MSGMTRAWRNWKHARKFTKVGKKCRFVGRFIDIDGHVEIGDYCRFRDYIIMRTRGEGRIILAGRNIISWGCIIESGGLVQMGYGSGMAERATIRDGTHMIYGTKESPLYTPHIVKPVIIGEHVWVGSGAYVSYGVTIGEGAVIGINSVVTKDIPPYEVWAGNPARFLTHRTDNAPPHKLAEAAALIEEHGIRKDRRLEED
jgi:acetyltransferase-like isoleucine patch superfamily enzyme